MIWNNPQPAALIAGGKSINLEFKKCRARLPGAVYKTVCAFLNRDGGALLLGVRNDGTVLGVDPSAVGQIRKEFITAVNNPQKLNPPVYLSVVEEEIDGKTLLRIQVPRSLQVHRCNGRIYDRNEDSDLDITEHTHPVIQLYQRKQFLRRSEDKVFPHLGLDDLDRDLIAQCRKRAVPHQKDQDRPWRDMDDLTLLKNARLYQTDPETSQRGITLAGVLLLGKQAPLLQALPHHGTDLLLRKVNRPHDDDRDFVAVNLVESHARIMAFVRKHLASSLFLKGMESINIRDAVFREVASNLLIHREYADAFPARLIIEHGRVRTENSNRPRQPGPIDPRNFTPVTKNPNIANFFRQIGYADELGSGMRNMMKYGRIYGGADPELIEGNIFRTTISVPDFSGAGAET